jgi:hypothetical protein
MQAGTRYQIDDTERNRPHIRLCHRMLSHGLITGLTAVELTAPAGTMPTARARHDGSWKALMAFPPAVYALLVEYFKHMAGLAPEQGDAAGTILVQLAGRHGAIGLRARRNERGVDELILHFPNVPASTPVT